MKFLVLLVFIFSCISCTNKNKESQNGSPVSGVFTIYSDEAYYPLVKVLTDGYMAVYPAVAISIDTTAGSNAFAKLADTSIRSAVTGSLINETDSIALNQRSIFPQIFHFATDAVVLISKSNEDSMPGFTFKYSKEFCLGNSVTPAVIRVITDQPGSENNRHINKRFDSADSCFQNRFVAGNHTAILERISEYPGEIGVIGWSHLCEKENPEVAKWRKRVEPVPFLSLASKLIYPSQSALMTGEYPLTRKLYLVTSEPYAGPATGFAAYVASHEGQRIIRLFGLAPAKTPPREIIFN